MLKKMKKQNQGFTLVEVVVSMLVLSIISVTILTAFTQAAKANTKSRKVQDAEKVLINFSEYLEAGGAITAPKQERNSAPFSSNVAA